MVNLLLVVLAGYLNCWFVCLIKNVLLSGLQVGSFAMGLFVVLFSCHVVSGLLFVDQFLRCVFITWKLIWSCGTVTWLAICFVYLHG